MNARGAGIILSLLIHSGVIAAVMWLNRLPPKPQFSGVETVLTLSMFDAVAATAPQEIIEPEPVKPEPVKPEPVKPEPVKPEPVKPEPVKPEPVKPEPVKPEPVKPEPVKPEPVKPEPVKPEPVKPGPAITANDNVPAPTPEVTVSPATSAASRAAEDSYVAAIREAIAKQRSYPRKARRKKQEGIVRIAFRVLADGQIDQLRLVASSGVKSLDNAALESVRKVGQFPAFPAAMLKTFRDFTVPVSFQLR